MALAIVTVADSISHLTVAGVTIYDIDQIPASLDRLTPCLFPNPDGFISEFTVVRESTGGGSTFLGRAEYTLNYQFVYASAGAGRIGLDLYDDMLGKACAVLDAVIAVDTMSGTRTIDVGDVLNFGTFLDPSGNAVMGCQFQFRVTEWIH